MSTMWTSGPTVSRALSDVKGPRLTTEESFTPASISAQILSVKIDFSLPADSRNKLESKLRS